MRYATRQAVNMLSQTSADDNGETVSKQTKITGYMDNEKDSEGRTASPSSSEVLKTPIKLQQKQILSGVISLWTCHMKMKRPQVVPTMTMVNVSPTRLEMAWNKVVTVID